MIIKTTVSCPIKNSFRVQQIAGLFDVPLAERAQESFQVELPSPEEDWTIGVIVGPSGSGKSTIARAAYGDAVYEQHPEIPDDPFLEARRHARRCPGCGGRVFQWPCLACELRGRAERQRAA